MIRGKLPHRKDLKEDSHNVRECQYGDRVPGADPVAGAGSGGWERQEREFTIKTMARLSYLCKKRLAVYSF
jgi:hypothetical protein